MPESRIAVLIVNTNEGEHLRRCLAELRGQTRRPDRTILIDNASRDGSLAMVRERFPEVEIVELGRNAGFAAANNAGARAAADCDLIALLNADAFPEATWLEALDRAASEHPECASIASLMRRATDPSRLDGCGDLYHPSGVGWRRYHMRSAGACGEDRPGPVFSACAGAALYRRDAFLELGGFDERWFVFWEDVDLGIRLQLAGHGAWYAPEAVVHHVGHGATQVASDFTVYHSERNMVWTWLRDMPASMLVRYLPLHLAVNAARIAENVRIGRTRSVLRAKLDALRGLPWVLADRRRVQRSRRVTPRELRAAMATSREASEVLPTLGRLDERVAALRRGART